MLDKERMPTHVAIIMDGNGRWAKKRNLPRAAGHNAGMKAMKKILAGAMAMTLSLSLAACASDNKDKQQDSEKTEYKVLGYYIVFWRTEKLF